jgi:hypothetical protein
MNRFTWRAGIVLAVISAGSLPLAAQHDHPAPEKLGTVDFSTTCAASVQSQFNRAVALLHSFAYSESEKSFRTVLALDPWRIGASPWAITTNFGSRR